MFLCSRIRENSELDREDIRILTNPATLNTHRAMDLMSSLRPATCHGLPWAVDLRNGSVQASRCDM